MAHPGIDDEVPVGDPRQGSFIVVCFGSFTTSVRLVRKALPTMP